MTKKKTPVKPSLRIIIILFCLFSIFLLSYLFLVKTRKGEMGDKPKTIEATVDTQKELTYFLPPKWETIQSLKKDFSIGYDLENYQYKVLPDNSISLYHRTYMSDYKYIEFMKVRLLTYKQSSPRQFILDNMNKGKEPTEEQAGINSSEESFLYNGRQCLILSLAGINTNWGMCEAGNNKAFMMTGFIQKEVVVSLKLEN